MSHAEDVAREHAAGSARDRRRSEQEKAANRIAALLASAETAATDGNEVLRDTYLEKAAALQLKYVIDDAMLASQNKDHSAEEIVEGDFCQESNTPLIKAKRELVIALADVFRGRSVMLPEVQGNKVNRRAKIRVWAHESDLAFITLMYGSLILQMQSMMAADERHGVEIGTINAKGASNGWRVSYAHAWVRRVYSRLLEDKKRQEGEANISAPGTALVLRDRKQDVDDRMEELYGRMSRMSYRDGAGHNAAGSQAGRAAGDRADLNRRKVASRNQQQIGS